MANLGAFLAWNYFVLQYSEFSLPPLQAKDI